MKLQQFNFFVFLHESLQLIIHIKQNMMNDYLEENQPASANHIVTSTCQS